MNRPVYCFDKVECPNLDNNEKTCFHILDKSLKDDCINSSFLGEKNCFLLYGANGSGKTILASDLKEYVNDKKKEIYKNLEIKVFNEKFINDFCYVYDEDKGINKSTSKNKEKLANSLTIENKKIQEISKKISENDLIKKQIEKINVFLLEKIETKLNYFGKHKKTLSENIDQERLKNLNKNKNKDDFDKFIIKIEKKINKKKILKIYEKEFGKKNIDYQDKEKKILEFLKEKFGKKEIDDQYQKKNILEIYEEKIGKKEIDDQDKEKIILEIIEEKFEKKEIDDEDKEKITNFIHQDTKKKFLNKIEEIEEEIEDFIKNIDNNNNINKEIDNLKKIWQNIKNKIYKNPSEEIKFEFKKEFINWQKKGRDFYSKNEKLKQEICLFCFNKGYGLVPEIENLLKEENIEKKNSNEKKLKKNKNDIKNNFGFLKENIDWTSNKEKLQTKIKDCLKDINEINLDSKEINIDREKEKIKNLFDSIKTNENTEEKEEQKFSDQNINFIKNWKKHVEKYNFITFLEKEEKKLKKELKDENEQLKKQLKNEIDYLKQNWKLKKEIEPNIKPWKEKTRVEIKGFDIFSSGERKTIAIILFFIIIKNEIKKKPNINFVIVFDDILDQLDFSANFKIHSLLQKYIVNNNYSNKNKELKNNDDLNNKIKLKIFLTHQLEFISFFFHIKRFFVEYFDFFIFQKLKDKNYKTFLLKLDFLKIYQTDSLIFKKYLKKILIKEWKKDQAIKFFIFWALWRKVIEKILTTQLNINNDTRVKIEEKGFFEAIINNIEKIFFEEKKEIRDDFKNILTKWKEIIKVENNSWKISSKTMKKMIKSTIMFFYKIKFFEEKEEEELTKLFCENEKKILLLEEKENKKEIMFAIDEKEIEKEIENLELKLLEQTKDENNKLAKKFESKSLEQTKDEEGNDIEENYQQLFLINFTYFLLKNIQNKKLKKITDWELEKKFVFFRHANNNLFPNLLAYNKELFEIMEKFYKELKDENVQTKENIIKNKQQVKQQTDQQVKQQTEQQTEQQVEQQTEEESIGGEI